ncbi:ferritin-like domain-containing protein [Nonomuraea turcica]|uniref:ferritin-like domain-containing protein n=1 Tax=Nonomuraea sp. G32 TaxID=3067274 RepID=UPI00273C0933|nr:ferritin-like domain-containing protein [Nonomuraea sp. G32]MDP4510535.1 ferritin-like domain-containing protein [Nonomuraea sp. G32]
MISAREVVEQAGLDVNILIDRLTAAATAELSAVYRYTILTAHPLGFAEEELRQILKDIRDEDRRHFDALVGRIYELDGRLPEDIRQFLQGRHTPPEDSSAGTWDPVTALIDDVRRAAHPYGDLCGLTEGRDQRTFALAQAIRNEKVEHQAWLDEFLGTGPPGRFHRGFRGRSPFLSCLASAPEGSGPTA